MPHNGSRISGEPLLKSFDESTAAGARPHEPPYPEREARRIEGGEGRDGLVQGSSVCILLLCGDANYATWLGFDQRGKNSVDKRKDRFDAIIWRYKHHNSESKA